MVPGDLLQWLSLAQKTGTLFVTSAAVQKRVFFRNGRIIASASNDPREYLGQFLMSYGFISEAELKKAMEVQAQTRVLLGKILVNINAIGESDLLRLMRLKVEEEIYGIFLWKDGDFHFVDDELPDMEMVPLQIDVTGIIMEGTRRVDEWSRIKTRISGNHLVPVVEKAIDQSVLSDAQRVIIQSINGHRSIAEIILESRSSDFTVCRTIFEFVAGGEIRLSEKDIAPFPESVAVDLEVEPDDEVQALVSRAQAALKKDDFEKCLRLLKAAQSLEPESVKVKNAFKGAETVVGSTLKEAGIHDASIPTLAKTFDEMTNMNFAPNEGFILSRINGMWDIGSLVKISPMRETDALLIFYKLLKQGIIELR